MSSREKILNALKANKPDYIDLPTWTWESNTSNVTDTFVSTLQRIGGTASIIKDITTIQKDLEETDRQQKRIVNNLAALTWNNTDNLIQETAIELEGIEVAIMEGSVGVAENGAIWVHEKNMVHRALPFICQHLILVLPINKIVSTMHEAYANIDLTRHGYGAFIAGPSKTADIEQALVIGAHGPRSLKVYLVE